MPIGPGSTIGVIGGGQLARMMAIEARRAGYRIAILDPDPTGPAGQLADLRIEGAWDDVGPAQELARASDVVTIDTEHVPADLLEAVSAHAPVRPSAAVLRAVQDRRAQRRFLAENRLPQVRHALLSRPADLPAAVERVGFPALLKTSRGGYDGRGQVRVAAAEDLPKAWKEIGEAPAVLETFVPFAKEISVLLARTEAGEIRFHPIAENVHRHQILRTTSVPAEIPSELVARAEEIGRRIATALGHVGMMAVELFVTNDGELLVNEIAPRVHNSGHFTFGACATSQFEQHLRAICGLPLGETLLLRPAVMLNLLGDLWRPGPPDWTAVLRHPSAHLHLYGKKRPFPGRKMGHVLVLADTVEEARRTAETIAIDLEGLDESRREGPPGSGT